MVEADRRKRVFIIHGRNSAAVAAMEQYLRVLQLDPINFDQLAADQRGTATIGNIVRAGLSEAHGIVALFTPDERAELREELSGIGDSAADGRRWQARQNVIFEAGMAYGMANERTIIVTLGSVDLFSDVDGIYFVKLDNSQEARARLRKQLRGIGCDLDEKTDDWLSKHKAGDFESCVSVPNFKTKGANSANCSAGESVDSGIGDKDGILQRNELVSIPGRQVRLGLAPKEVDYIIGYLVEHRFNIDPSRESQSSLRQALVRQYPQRNSAHGAPFRISRYPVTNEQFAIFAAQTKYVTTAERLRRKGTWKTQRRVLGQGHLQHPVTCVSFEDAVEFCKWLGVRLPTADEYEKVVRGTEQRLFSWGSTWEPDSCNDIFWVEHVTTSPVGTFARSISSDGVYDLTGNVFEWVTSTGETKVVPRLVGGAFDKSVVWRGHATAVGAAMVHDSAPNIGFRFASDVK